MSGRAIGDADRLTLRAVFFDAGNTLLSLDYPAIVEALAAEGIPVGREQVWRAECRARVRLDPLLAEIAVRESAEVFTRYMRFTFDELEIAWGARAERVLTTLRDINRGQGLWRAATPGASEVLHELTGRGYLVGVISNADGRIETLLRNAGLFEPLSVIIDSHVVGVEKPDPRIFDFALERAGLSPEDAVYVGDFYSLDVVGARRAGLEAILLDPVGAWPPLDCSKIAALGEVADLLPPPSRSAGDRLTPK